jgi:hypothetical protein
MIHPHSPFSLPFRYAPLFATPPNSVNHPIAEMIAPLARNISPYPLAARVTARSARDNGPVAEGPDEVRVSRPVLWWGAGLGGPGLPWLDSQF